MTDSFNAKVIPIGTSLGVLIPKDILDKDKIKKGEKIKLIVIKERNIEDVLKLRGTAKGAKPFVRDKTDRVDRW